MQSKGPIIIIEDDEDDRQIMQEIFTELKVTNTLHFFKEGYEVLDYLTNTRERPLLIITDVNLPGMNGLELRQAILQDARLRKKNIPFVFLSTSDGQQILEKLYGLELQGYFQKQTSYPEIKQQIRLIVDYWMASKQLDY